MILIECPTLWGENNVSVEESELLAELARLCLQVRQNQEFLDGLPDALIEIDLKTTRVMAINVMTTILMGVHVRGR